MVHWFELVLEPNRTVRTSSEQFSSVQVQFRQNPNGSVHGSGKRGGEPNRTELW